MGLFGGSVYTGVVHKCICPGSVSTPVAVSTPHPQILVSAILFHSGNQGSLEKQLSLGLGGWGWQSVSQDTGANRKGPQWPKLEPFEQKMKLCWIITHSVK